MNSSEPLQPLTSHEEKLTAYLDGAMPPEDAAVFEQANPEAVELRRQHQVLSQALKKHSVAPALGNRDFFNHQILREIAPPAPVVPRASVPWWKLLLAGATCAVVTAAVILANFNGQKPTQGGNVAKVQTSAPKYVASVTHVEAGDHLLTAKVVDADGLAVVWVDGMDKLSKDYVLQ